MANDKSDLLLLFQRPYEPIFGVKEDNTGKVRVDVPTEFYTDHYKDIVTEVQNRFGESDVDRNVPVRSVAPPNLSFADGLGRNQAFSLFNTKHQRIAGQLIQVFMDAPDVTTLMSIASYARDRLNPHLYQYALSVAMQHRPDTRDQEIPSISETFPSQFVDAAVFPRLLEESQFVPPNARRPIVIPPNYTATEKEEEQRLAYFREDIGINLHHWHWHLVYPGSGPIEIVRKDRRGELFYYMHSQIIARYNVDRLCNKLARVRRLNNLREPIPEAYFPKLVRSATNQAYPPRISNIILKDIDRPDDETVVEVADLERWRDRVHEAIDQGFVVSSTGQRIPLDIERGIDILGDILEASDLSPNRQLYGNFHNMGHNVIAYSHDPDHRHLEEYAVMGDVTTAMRDPIFYRWHSHLDSIFQKYKSTLPAYDINTEIAYNGITVQNVQIQLNRKNTPANVLLTYWQRSEINLGAGLDFGQEGDVFAQFTHLQHAAFTYRITVNNQAGGNRRGTCRIFFCPQVDERGMTLNFRDQRPLMIEMDRFVVNLKPGSNTVSRTSEQSSITIPYQRTFRNVGAGARPTDAAGLARFNFCGCGWPQHLLIPKGSPEGTNYSVFVMISDYNLDSVNDTYDPNDVCSDSFSFCGVRDKKYPDRRAMGFPFDRNNTSRTLQDFANLTSNMGLGQVQIKFTNTYVQRT